jgi:hypothetical protein
MSACRCARVTATGEASSNSPSGIGAVTVDGSVSEVLAGQRLRGRAGQRPGPGSGPRPWLYWSGAIPAAWRVIRTLEGIS